MIIRTIAAIGAIILILGIVITGFTIAATNVTARQWRELINRSPVRVFSAENDLDVRVNNFGVNIIPRRPINRVFSDFSIQIEDWRVIINLRNRTVVIG